MAEVGKTSGRRRPPGGEDGAGDGVGDGAGVRDGADDAPSLPGLGAEPPPHRGAETSTQPGAEPSPHYAGHRERLRQRFLSGGRDSVQDYELLELLLFSAIPRRDVKPLAKEMIRSLGSLWAVVTAQPERLRREFNFSDATITAITVAGAIALHGQRQLMMKRPVLAGWDSLVTYCQAAMAHETTEQLRLLFLDRKNGLIADEVQQRGTIDHTPAYPREIIKRALDLGAHAVILVHNHPTGDPNPSRDDIAMTKDIVRAGQAMGVLVHDHLIIARGQTTSFKTLGLL